MVLWGDSFWGDGNRSLEVLSSNVKNGAIAIEEFQRFLNESAQCESTYCKSLSRLQSQLIKIQHVGTFTPIWNLIRDLLDKISSTHLATVNFYQELLRDIHNYQDVFHKKVKTHIQKDGDITRASDLISQLNNSLNTVNKAKEQYHSIALDYERAKRVGNNSTSSLTASQDNNSSGLAQTAINSLTSRQTDRLEKKYRQAQDDYKLTIEKYNVVRNDYEKRFYDTCTKYQDFEIDHIEKMLAFSLNYSDVFQRNNEQIRMAQNDFNDKLKLLTGKDLLNIFVEQKKTGTDRPAVLQFEEPDAHKSSMQLTNSAISDTSIGQDDFNSYDQTETSLPSFQAHFSVTSPTAKTNEHNRALSPNSPSHLPATPSQNPTTIPLSPSNTTTQTNPVASANLMNRSQETSGSSDQTSNPFDLKIRRPKFPGFFGSNRKDKKDKKNEKKLSTNTKSNKTSQVQTPRDQSNKVELQSYNSEPNDFVILTDNNDDYANITKNKCPTPEPYTQSSPSTSTNDVNRLVSKSTIPTASSKISKSSSSSDSFDDDDDDNPMLKIEFKINPIAKPSSDGDDETKIMNAMRLIDKNIGNLVTKPRGSPHKPSDVNKSVSSEQIGAKFFPPPPPVPSRPATAIPNSATEDTIDQPNIFPPQDEFDRSPSNSIRRTSTNEESFPIPLQSTTESKISTSLSSTEDDAEVANSFPNDNSLNKTIPFPILQVPHSHQSNQSTSTSVSPSNITIKPIFSNNAVFSTEQGMSPLTIGAADQIPLAIAFQETIHVMMSGDNQENWKSRIIGEMLISFPALLLNLFIDPTRLANTLEFRLNNIDYIENIIPKSSLVTQNESTYSFDMTELKNVLRSLQEKTPSSRFFNVNVLNYEVKQSHSSNIPIEISSQWTSTFDNMSVIINYRFNDSVFPESIRLNNDSVILYTIITDGQQIKEASPTAEWSASEHKLWWKVPYVNNGTGSLSATVVTMQADTTANISEQQQQPLTTSSIVNAYFVGENALFSSVDFDLICRGYRLSLLKKKILSGKYQSEPDLSEPIHLFQRPAISS